MYRKGGTFKIHAHAAVFQSGWHGDMPTMRTAATMRTMFGPASVPVRTTRRVTLTQEELFAAIRQVERHADEARAGGNDDLARRLDWRAAALRETAR